MADESVGNRVDTDARVQFVSDVFHAISQPLTALRCSLELALMEPPSVDRYGAALRESLTHAERVSCCAEFLRAMAQADELGNPCAMDLRAAVLSACNEFAPVLEWEGYRLSVVPGEPVRIVADAEKVNQAMLYLLDAIATEKRDVIVTVGDAPPRVEIAVQSSNELRSERAEQSFALAHRIFRAQGAVAISAHDGNERTTIVTWTV
jgi:hypothetical protein